MLCRFRVFSPKILNLRSREKRFQVEKTTTSGGIRFSSIHPILPFLVMVCILSLWWWWRSCFPLQSKLSRSSWWRERRDIPSIFSLDKKGEGMRRDITHRDSSAWRIDRSCNALCELYYEILSPVDIDIDVCSFGEKTWFVLSSLCSSPFTEMSSSSYCLPLALVHSLMVVWGRWIFRHPLESWSHVG